MATKKKQPDNDPEVDAELVAILGDDDDIPIDERIPLSEKEMTFDRSISSDPPMQQVGEDDEVGTSLKPIDDPVMALSGDEPDNKPISTLQVTEKVDEQDEIGIRRILSKFGDSVDEIIDNQKSDRQQINEAISYIEGVIKGLREANEKVPSIYVDAWTRLLQAKADVNANASKVLDSIAKLLSAGKGNDLVLQLGVINKGNLDLEGLLEQPAYEDEELGNPNALG